MAADSADVWGRAGAVSAGCLRRPKEVAGCPPDAFSDAGQLWGNPLYDWAHHEKKPALLGGCGASAMPLNFYDILRIDHFRGFDTYYAIPYGAKTAQTGEWRSGPGMKLFRAVKQALGDVPIVAEDLGELFPSVYELLAESGFPGMKVLQFAFGPGDSEYLPHNHPVHCVVYTGTHDNTTAAAWYRTAAPAQRKKAAAYLGLNREEALPPGWCAVRWPAPESCALSLWRIILPRGRSAHQHAVHAGRLRTGCGARCPASSAPPTPKDRGAGRTVRPRLTLKHSKKNRAADMGGIP